MTKRLKVSMFIQDDGYLLGLHPFESKRVKEKGIHPARCVFVGTGSNFRAKLDNLSAEQHQALTKEFIATALSVASVLAGGGNISRLEKEFGGIEVIAGHTGPIIWTWEELVEAHATGD